MGDEDEQFEGDLLEGANALLADLSRLHQKARGTALERDVEQVVTSVRRWGERLVELFQRLERQE